MGKRAGFADLPLHGGRVPAWLAQRMARLGRIIVEALVLHYGRDEVLRRLSHPFWFQSFGAVMGMDWHSSGITTSVIGALKRGLAPVRDELGIYVCGGRGRHSRATPQELLEVGERTGLDGAAMGQTSRLVAKVDNVALQDGFQIYLHAFVVGADGKWAVVQQGMHGPRKTARRYHWLDERVGSFLDDPHAAIAGPQRSTPILNLADARAADARDEILQVVERGPERVLGHLPVLRMPDHHDVRGTNVDPRRLHAGLAAAAAANPQDFPSLLLTPGVGPRTMESLALVAEIIHGRPARFSDPARYSLAHGGKDGHPFPVPLKVYDATLRVMRDAVDSAKLGQKDKLSAVKALDSQARLLEAHVTGEPVEAYIERERRISHHYGGMTVMGPAKPPQPAGPKPPRPKRHTTRPAHPDQPRLPGL